jgi:hypothetical protein
VNAISPSPSDDLLRGKRREMTSRGSSSTGDGADLVLERDVGERHRGHLAF